MTDLKLPRLGTSRRYWKSLRRSRVLVRWLTVLSRDTRSDSFLGQALRTVLAYVRYGIYLTSMLAYSTYATPCARFAAHPPNFVQFDWWYRLHPNSPRADKVIPCGQKVISHPSSEVDPPKIDIQSDFSSESEACLFLALQYEAEHARMHMANP